MDTKLKYAKFVYFFKEEKKIEKNLDQNYMPRYSKFDVEMFKLQKFTIDSKGWRFRNL